jgi:hypothetical protein
MTYKRLFYLKYKMGLTTYDLVRQYPAEIDRVSEVALVEVPEAILREILQEDETFQRLMRLKKRYMKFIPRDEDSRSCAA